MRTATLIVLALAAGCATPKVEAGSPRPNVDLPKSERSLRLQLEAAVRDEYGSELYGATIPVSGWRSTLERGFQSAFAGAFKLSDKNADLTVVVAEAELVFAGTAYTRTGKPVSAEAQVRYKARLLDENGTVVRRSARFRRRGRLPVPLKSRLWRPPLSNRCTSRLPENFSRKRRVAELLLTRESCEAQASSRSLGSNGDPVHQPALNRDLNLFGITERRATVTRRSSTQDGLRSDPTRRVGSRLLRYRRSNHQGMSL